MRNTYFSSTENIYMTQTTKFIGLGFLFGMLAALVLLSGSLSNLQLQPGSSFSFNPSSEEAITPQSAPPVVETKTYSIRWGGVALVFAFFMLYLATRIVISVDRKSYLRLALAGIILLIIIVVTSRIPLGEFSAVPSVTSEIYTPPTFEYTAASLGEPPQSLIWFVIIGCILVIGIPAAIILRGWVSAPRGEADLLQGAEDAVKALKAGGELRNVILRCYFQMTEAIKKEVGIERDYNMTVREFENWLESMGFPHEPVRQLTALFEKARYGEEALDANDEEGAVESLNAIIEFCRTKKEGTE
jgi:hypothetical protein